MRKNILYTIITIMLASIFVLSGCASQAAQTAQPAQSSQPAQPTQSKAEPVNELYVEVSALSSLDYFWDHQEGLKLAGDALGVKTEYVGPAEYDMNAMITAFDQTIAKKPAGILVVGFEDTLNAEVNKAIEAGIPVVTVDADLPRSKRVAFVGTGNFNAGYQVGKTLAESIGKKGKVAFATKPGQPNLEDRQAGFSAALKEYPDIQMVQLIDTQSDPTVAATATAAVLQKYPDLAGIGTCEAGGGAGVAKAVEEASKAGKVKIVSMDRGDILNAVKKGTITASIVQNTQLMPYYGLTILYNIKHSKVHISNDDAKAGIIHAPIMIDTGTVLVDQKNVDLYIRGK